MKLPRLKTGGREKGTPNKTTAEVKQMLKAILENQLEILDKNKNELTNTERIALAKALLPFTLPKLQSVIVREGEPLGQFKPIQIQFDNGDNQ